MLDRIRQWFDPGVVGGVRRSSEWSSVRKKHLEEHSFCVVCGGKKKLQVHHIKPFHLFPELELDKLNLVTLCTRKKYGINCHQLVGHGGSFRKYNKSCIKDIYYISNLLSK